MSIQLSVAVVFGARLSTDDDVSKALTIDNATIEPWLILDGLEVIVFVRASYVSLAGGRHDVREPVYAFSRSACVSDDTVAEWDLALSLALEAAGIDREKISPDAWGWMVVCNAS